MKFGLSDEQYSILNELLIKPLKTKNASVYVFGSRARGSYHPYSDIDILFIDDQKNPVSQSEIAKINEDLEESRLEIKVDIVRSEDLAKSYADSVNEDKILIE
ncbi:MAG: nucleotidyltransferase domain-containing protein [Bdellovibrionales bacterium]|nr:nucleotidyltransferase domain-containing protein [Bdellovibrionales bacterium]